MTATSSLFFENHVSRDHRLPDLVSEMNFLLTFRVQKEQSSFIFS